MIDNQTGTYWVYPILLGAPDQSGIVVKLELELLGYQDVNFIEFEPATLTPFILERVLYVDVNSENQTLDLDDIIINGKVRIDIDMVTTKKLIFYFRQKDYQNVQYNFNQNSKLWERTIAQDSITLDDIDKTLVNDEILQTLGSQQLQTLNDITETISYQNVNMYEYLMGFDNIRVGFTRYEDKSIFVSAMLEGNKVGIVGLRTTENRLYKSDIPFTSFEYNIFKQNFASDNSFVDSERFAILPAGQESIVHERLMFTETITINDDTAKLRFYPDGDVVVYKDFNLIPLDLNYDYIVVDNGSFTPKEYKIKLLDPIVTSIYTVSYSPLYSATSVNSEVWLDKQRTAKLKRGNIVEFTNDRPNAIVTYSQVYLMILIRINSVDDTQTPSVEEYRLLIGTIDKEKYIE
jgi:hypothetical protein